MADFLGRRVGIVGARLASIKHGYMTLADKEDARLEAKARRLG